MSEKFVRTVTGKEIYAPDEAWSLGLHEGSVWRLGGKVNWDNYHPYPYTLYFETKEDAVKYADEYNAVNIKLHKPLFFTSGDFTSVYKGTKVFVVYRANPKEVQTVFAENFVEMQNKAGHPLDHVITFASQKRAEDYLFDNYKQFSLKDVQKCLREGQSYQYHDTTIDNLIKLAKSR